MELLQLKYFCTVAKMLNISHAAAFHSIPQPAMSKTISKLEDELGVKLFTRQKNRIFLTTQGAVFYEKISAAISEIEDATDIVKASARRSSAKSVQLNLMVSVLQVQTAEFIADFHNAHPDISISTSKCCPKKR